MALRAAGIYRGGVNWANYFVWEKTLSEFLAKIDEYHTQGLRLIDVETYVVNGGRRWAGVFRAGNWTQNFVHGVTVAGFTQQLNAPANQGLAPSNFELYADNGQVLVAAVLRSGLNVANTPAAFAFDMTSSQLNTANNQNINLGARLVDIQPYDSGGQLRWAAIWLPGSWDSYLLTDLTFQNFKTQTQQLFDNDGQRLTDLETYVVNGDRLWAGIGRQGNWANYFIAGYTLQNFKNKVQDQFNQNGYRLIRLEVYSN